MNRVSLSIVAVLTILVGSLVGWFLTTHERYEKEITIAYSGEAATNPFYAAELFLEKYNMQVESLSSILELKEMPDTNDVLFIPTKRYDIGADRVTELMEWVRKGGHLIVQARYAQKKGVKTKDDLFDELGVTSNHSFDVLPFFDKLMDELEDEPNDEQTSPAEESDINTDSETNDEGSTQENRWGRTVITIKVNDQVEDKKVRFFSNWWMENGGRYETSWDVQGEKGAHLLEFNIGKGWVTLLSEIDFITNRHLDKYDHAAFLHTLVHIDNTNRKLWIIRNGDSPSLLSIMSDEYYPVVMSFVAFVLFWLWYASPRFGPMAPNPQAVRRSMSEHIVSTGHFQWRSRNRNELLHSVQKALHEQIAQTRPLWVRLSDKELPVKLAKLAGLNEAKVYTAITSKSVERELEFTSTIEVFSKIRKRL